MEPTNDGGVVVALFLMVAAIAFAIFNAVATYESSTSTADFDTKARLFRLLSGWANIGNSYTHVLWVLYMQANKENESEYWIEERKLGGVEGPVGLAIFNFLAGMSALMNYGMKFPVGWNSFVIVAGTFMPVVWPRFLEEGLTAWPYTIIFIWFAIFAFELTAVTCSVAYFTVNVSGGYRSV